MFQPTQFINFRIGLFVALLLCAIAGSFLWYYGKIDSFLIINSHHHPALDVLFRYGTYLGDGLIYIPLLVYCIFFNRSFFIAAVLSILICLFLTHFLKRVVFPEQLRPISLEAQHVVLHKIPGVYMNRSNSFPSGHTATAFSTALLLTAVVRNWFWAVAAVLLALLVAYSRVYLGQHFVSDVFGGMLIGIITAIVSVWLHPIITRSLPEGMQAKLQKPVLP